MFYISIYKEEDDQKFIETYLFYTNSRIDGLHKRQVIIYKNNSQYDSIQEWYLNRTDLLISRHILLDNHCLKDNKRIQLNISLAQQLLIENYRDNDIKDRIITTYTRVIVKIMEEYQQPSLLSKENKTLQAKEEEEEEDHDHDDEQVSIYNSIHQKNTLNDDKLNPNLPIQKTTTAAIRRRIFDIKKEIIRIDYHYNTLDITSEYDIIDKKLYKNNDIKHAYQSRHKMKCSQAIINKFIMDFIDIERNLINYLKEYEDNIDNEVLLQLANDINYYGTSILPSSSSASASASSSSSNKKGSLNPSQQAPQQEEGEEGEDLWIQSNGYCKVDLYDKAYEAQQNVNNHQTNTTILNHHHTDIDYLTPFLLKYKDQSSLTKLEIKQIKENCLHSLKERLLLRATIIQQHYETEKQKLANRQAIYKRKIAQNIQDVQYKQDYQQIKFKLDILQSRLIQHEQDAIEKFKQMEQKLNQDPRLQL